MCVCDFFFSLLFSSTTHYPKMLQHRYFYQIIDDGKMFSTRKDRYWATESEKKYYYYYQCRSTTTTTYTIFGNILCLSTFILSLSLSFEFVVEFYARDTWIIYGIHIHRLLLNYWKENIQRQNPCHHMCSGARRSLHVCQSGKMANATAYLEMIANKNRMLTYLNTHKSIRRYTINGEKIFWMW